jgi:hypothetical protein
MRKIVIVSLLIAVFALLAFAQYRPSATCPYDGVQSEATGATRTNPHPPPVQECQYSHQYWDKDHWATHTFWQPCGF